MVAGNTLMVGQSLHQVFRHIAHAVEVGKIRAWPTAIWCGSLIKRLAGRGFTKWFDRFNYQLSFWLDAK